MVQYETLIESEPKPNSVLASQLDGSFFHQPRWIEVLKETFGYNIREISLLNFDNAIVCKLDLCIVKGLFGTRLVSLPFSDYGGPLSGESDSRTIGKVLSAAIDEVARECGARYVLLKSSTPGVASALMEEEFHVIEDLGAFVVNLRRPLDSIAGDFESDVRRRMRKGLQNGLEFVKVEDKEAIRDFYSIYLRDMRRHGSPPHPRRYFENIWKVFGASNDLRLYGCQLRGERIGYALHFLYEDKALYYSGVWPGSARDLGVPSFLIANSIRTFAEDGFTWYDFGRTHNPSGEFLFKRSFGGEYRTSNSLIKIYNGGEYLEPSNWKYRSLSRMLRHTPIGLLSLVGPRIKEQLE